MVCNCTALRHVTQWLKIISVKPWFLYFARDSFFHCCHISKIWRFNGEKSNWLYGQQLWGLFCFFLSPEQYSGFEKRQKNGIWNAQIMSSFDGVRHKLLQKRVVRSHFPNRFSRFYKYPFIWSTIESMQTEGLIFLGSFFSVFFIGTTFLFHLSIVICLCGFWW